MKDIKSYIIGFLSCACLILIMGQGKNNEFDTIKAKKIILIDDSYQIRIGRGEGSFTDEFGVHISNWVTGSYSFLDENHLKVAYQGTRSMLKNDGLFVWDYDEDKDDWNHTINLHSLKGNGHIKFKNKYGNNFFGVFQDDKNGTILTLSDKDGTPMTMMGKYKDDEYGSYVSFKKDGEVRWYEPQN